VTNVGLQPWSLRPSTIYCMARLFPPAFHGR
jgi:hypothetical protein